jgi:hypothetical protein
MTSDECKASLRVLLAIARADGQVHEREKDVLDFLAHHAFSTDTPRLSMDLDVEVDCARIRSEKLKRLTFSAALVIADIDEVRTEQETALLARIHKGLGLPGEPESGFVKAAHRARMAQVTLKLTEANTEFFRAVAKQSEGGTLEQARYEELLERLADKKNALLKSVFGG